MNNALTICQANVAHARANNRVADPPVDHRNHDVEALRAAIMVIENVESLFRADFKPYLKSNHHVYKEFERQANRAWDRGKRHYSGRRIIEVLRHESDLADDGHEFKLNDWWTPDLCRLYMLLHPEREGFFETRSGSRAVRVA